MGKTKPVYKKLLIAAIVIYVIANCFMISELYYKVMDMEHNMMHLTGEHPGKIQH